MDRIWLKVERHESEDRDVVAIFIDDRRLTDILREIELPFARREGHEDMAGQYVGLPLDVVFFPSRQFLGQPAKGYPWTDKICVLECECGEPGCWPFLVRLTLEGDKVTWSEFEQPHRTPEKGPTIWSYECLPPFVFERAQYQSELTRRGE